MQHSVESKNQLDNDKDIRKKFFLFANQVYYKLHSDNSAEIQLLFNQNRYFHYVKDLPRREFGPGGDYYPASACCAYLEEIFKSLQHVKHVKAVDITPPGQTEWRIVLAYKGDKNLCDEAVENLKEYGPPKSDTLSHALSPLIPSASHSGFWPGAPHGGNSDEKKPAASSGDTVEYTSFIKSQPKQS